MSDFAYVSGKYNSKFVAFCQYKEGKLRKNEKEASRV